MSSFRLLALVAGLHLVGVLQTPSPANAGPPPSEIFFEIPSVNVFPEDFGFITLEVTRRCTSPPCLTGDADIGIVSRIGGSATAGDDCSVLGVDYRIATTALHWPSPDDDYGTLDVMIELCNDSESEPGTENFIIELDCSNPGGADVCVPPTSVFLEIIDDDADLPESEVFFELTSISATEGDGTVELAVTRDCPGTICATPMATVEFEDIPGSAGADDYVGTMGTLAWEKGELSTRNISVTLLDDDVAETLESFMMQLHTPAGTTLRLGEETSTVEIVDDDFAGSVRFAEATFQVDETSGTAVITIERTGGSSGPASVDFATSAGQGANSEDYVDTSGTFTWANGEDGPQTFEVTILDDTVEEGAETVALTLSNAVGADMGAQNTADLEIVDDDVPGVISFVDGSLEVDEDASAATLTVQRTDGSSGAASAEVTTSGTSATAGEDFVPLTATVAWAHGESGPRTLTVEIVDDALEEGDETLSASLANPITAALGEPQSIEVLIHDDDTPTQLSIASGDRQAGQQGFTLRNPLVVRVSSAEEEPVEGAAVDWEITRGDVEFLEGRASATNGEGEARNRVRVTSAPGEEIEVTASLAANPSLRVVFTVLTTEEMEIEEVIQDICDQDPLPPDLETTCDDLEDSGVDPEMLLPEAPEADLALGITTAMLGDIISRLVAIRSGATRLSRDQLALNLQGTRITAGEVLAGLTANHEADELDIQAMIAEQRTGGGASADRQAAADPPDDPQHDSRFDLFVSGIVAIGNRPTRGEEKGFDFDSGGLTVGADALLNDRFVLGGALGAWSTKTKLHSEGGKVDTEGFSLSSYLLYTPAERLFFDAILTVGRNDFASRRVIDFEGNSRGPQTATGNFSSDQLALSLGAGYGRSAGAMVISTSARASWVEAKIDAYQEHGAPGFNLEIDGQRATSLLTSAGLELLYNVSTRKGVFAPKLRLAYLHEFEDDSRLIAARFIDDPQGFTFTFSTERPDRDYFKAGFGLTAWFAHSRSAFLLYETHLDRDDLNIYLITFGLRMTLN